MCPNRIATGFTPRIVEELKDRGIKDSLIGQYLLHDEMFWWETVSQFCKKKYQEQDLNFTMKSSAWLVLFLMQRGFDSEHIYPIVGYNNVKLHE